MAHHENEPSAREAQPILELQHRWVAALLSGDTETLDTILVDSYVDTDDTGSRTDKAGILTALKSGDLKLISIRLLETDVHKHGDCAVLTGASAQSGVFQGQPIAPRYFSPPSWFSKTESGKQQPHTELPFLSLFGGRHRNRDCWCDN